MDWTKFLQDNSSSMFTLFGVFLGSLITFLISYTNTRFEAAERDKDRKEKRKTERTELALELATSDIRVVEESIDNTLRAIRVIEDIEWKKNFHKLTIDDAKALMESMLVDENSQFRKLAELDAVADKLAYALGEEFYSEFKKLDAMWREFAGVGMEAIILAGSPEKEPVLIDQMTKQAGRLHNMLNQRLISMRDNQ